MSAAGGATVGTCRLRSAAKKTTSVMPMIDEPAAKRIIDSSRGSMASPPYIHIRTFVDGGGRSGCPIGLVRDGDENGGKWANAER
jgi:hypothetical protein